MQRYEYKTVETRFGNGSIELMFEKMSKEGWRLHSARSSVGWIWERPVSQELPSGDNKGQPKICPCGWSKCDGHHM